MRTMIEIQDHVILSCRRLMDLVEYEIKQFRKILYPSVINSGFQ